MPSDLSFIYHGPYPYYCLSAGFRAGYQLCHELQLRGHRAGISTVGMIANHPHHGTDPHSIELADNWPIKDYDAAVHIYPDIIVGNPADSAKVVRWLCERDGRFAGWNWLRNLPEQSIGIEPSDLVFAWDPQSAPTAPPLHVDIMEPFFFPVDGPRGGTYYWVGKGESYDVEESWFEITDDQPASRQMLALIFQQAERLITFDNNSFIAVEAEYCGCKVERRFDKCIDPVDRTAQIFVDNPYPIAREIMQREIDDFVSICKATWE